MQFEIRQRETGPLHISRWSFESCPIAKSPRVSSNPQQPQKRARMQLFSEQRELKRAETQSHRLPARHWLKAKKSPCAQATALHLRDRQQAGGGGVDIVHLTLSYCPETPRPRARVALSILANGTSHSSDFWPLIPLSDMIVQACVCSCVHVCAHGFSW
jgi:hypothetical protein